MKQVSCSLYIAQGSSHIARKAWYLHLISWKNRNNQRSFMNFMPNLNSVKHSKLSKFKKNQEKINYFFLGISTLKNCPGGYICSLEYLSQITHISLLASCTKRHLQCFLLSRQHCGFCIPFVHAQIVTAFTFYLIHLNFYLDFNPYWFLTGECKLFRVIFTSNNFWQQRDGNTSPKMSVFVTLD